MTKKQKSKQKFSLYNLLGKIGDILFIPILVISLFSSISMLVQKRNNTPTSFFGYSLVNILSGSMTDAGLKKGDTVITVTADVDNIKLGDVIAFYELRNDPTDTKPKLLVERFKSPGTIKSLNPDNEIIYSEDNITISTYQKVEKTSALTKEDAQKKNKRIIFHMVIGIYVDEDGSVFYETKGTNSGIDSPVRSDFVVGKYVHTPQFVKDTISFCGSGIGMIILVCVPLSLLVLFQCLSLIKQIEEINYEKQLLSGKKHFKDEDVIQNFNGNNMETYNKVYLYFLTDKFEQEDVLKFMWGNLLQKDNLSNKEEETYNTLKIANSKLTKSKKAYWDTWLENTKGFNKKKIKEYYEEAMVYDVFIGANTNNLAYSTVTPIAQPTIEETVARVVNSTKQEKTKTEAKATNNQKTKPNLVKSTSATVQTKDVKPKVETLVKNSTKKPALIIDQKKSELKKSDKTNQIKSNAKSASANKAKPVVKKESTVEQAKKAIDISKQKPIKKEQSIKSQNKSENQTKVVKDTKSKSVNATKTTSKTKKATSSKITKKTTK